MVGSQCREKYETFSGKQTKSKKGLVVQCLPSKHEALSSIPSTGGKKKKDDGTDEIRSKRVRNTRNFDMTPYE
jgi:hypothetical protein